MLVVSGSCLHSPASLDIGAGHTVKPALLHAKGFPFGSGGGRGNFGSHQFFFEVGGSPIGNHRVEGEGFLEVGVFYHHSPMFV